MPHQGQRKYCTTRGVSNDPHSFTNMKKADFIRCEVVILISWCCIITNALDVLLKCIDYLEKPSRDRTASTFIRRTGNKDVIDGWAEVVEKDDQERKERISSQTQKRHRHRHQAKSGLNKSQRQVRRYMKKLAHTERTCLMNSLDQLGDNGKLCEASDSESEEESTE